MWKVLFHSSQPLSLWCLRNHHCNPDVTIHPWRTLKCLPRDNLLGPSCPGWSHPGLCAPFPHTHTHNPTTMHKTILMHREARGLAQPITCRRRGSAVIYMLMVLLEGMKTGPGGSAGGGAVGPCWDASWGGFRGTAAQSRAYNQWAWKPICWSSSGPPSPFTRCLIGRAGCTLPLSPPPKPPWHMDTARAFQTQIS